MKIVSGNTAQPLFEDLIRLRTIGGPTGTAIAKSLRLCRASRLAAHLSLIRGGGRSQSRSLWLLKPLAANRSCKE